MKGINDDEICNFIELTKDKVYKFNFYNKIKTFFLYYQN